MQKTISPRREPWSKRPTFAPKQLLDAERLNAGFADELARQQLLTRALHGWGVVFGYEVKRVESAPSASRSACVVVTCGLAIDRHGRMLYTPDRRITLDDIEGKKPKSEGSYTLLVHYAERLVPPHDHGPCATVGPQWTEHGVVFTLRAGCEPIDTSCPSIPEDECVSPAEFVRRRLGSSTGQPGPAPDLAWACVDGRAETRTECGTWCYDATAGVPIACVDICDWSRPAEESGKPGGDHAGRTAACEPCYSICEVREDQASVVRHVYRTPLLYELINCCDVVLPRVTAVSWQEWLDLGWESAVPWGDFAARIQVTDPAADPADGFTIWFSRPIHIATLHSGSVILAAIPQEPEADYWVEKRVPLEEVRPVQPTTGPAGDELARAVQLIPTSDWIAAEITGNRSSLMYGARFELTIRGQLLRDGCGRMLDARPVGMDGSGRCQGRPGDDFVSVFEVGRREKWS